MFYLEEQNGHLGVKQNISKKDSKPANEVELVSYQG